MLIDSSHTIHLPSPLTSSVEVVDAEHTVVIEGLVCLSELSKKI